MPSKPKKLPQRLPEKLLQIRKNLNLSQSEMVRRLNADSEINRGKISEYELGKRIPPLHLLLRYARASGTTMEVLVDDLLDFPG